MEDPNHLVLEKLNAFLQADGEPFMVKVPAPMKATALMADGRFRNVALVGNEELIVKKVRSGKRDEFIFEFEPADARPYVRLEMPDRLAMKTFEEFEAVLVSALGADPSKTTFGRAKGALVRSAKKEIAEKVEKARAAEIAELSTSSDWGIF